MSVEERIGKTGGSASEEAAVASDSQSPIQDPARRRLPHEYLWSAVDRARTLTVAAAAGTRNMPGKVVSKVRELDANHKEVADRIDTVSMGLGITSGVVSAGAVFAAPSGLTAIGVTLGLTSAPLVVTAAPIVGAAAAVSGVISGGAYFYSKWKSSKEAKAALAARESQPLDAPDAAQ